MKKKGFLDFLENYPLSLFGYERDDAYLKTDRYIDDGIRVPPLIFYLALSNYAYNSFRYNGFYVF